MVAKKNIIVFVILTISFMACWGIGQKLQGEDSVHMETGLPTNEEDAESSPQVSCESADFEQDWFAGAIFENASETSDNPWGITAGMIETEEGKCIFLTPNTAVCFANLDKIKGLEFSYRIHPWVQADSDGAGIDVTLFDREEKILYQEMIRVDADTSWTEYGLNLSEYPLADTVRLSCNSGENDEASCDWVILRYKENEEAKISAELQKTAAEDAFPLCACKSLPYGGGYEALDGFANAQPVLCAEQDTWECVDVLNPSVIRWNDTYYNYYSGYDGDTWRTGLALSEDGVHWVKSEDNPVLDIREDCWDASYIAANGSAIVYKDKVYYYYQGLERGTDASAIGLAISSDGEHFEQRTMLPVLRGGEDWECAGVGDPYVISFRGRLFMYYLGMDALGIQRLGVAFSDNGIDWAAYENNPIMDLGVRGAFDEKGLGEPSVIYQAPYFYMLYTGRNAEEQRNIGMAVSLDGVTWVKLHDRGMADLSKNTWNNQVICDTTLLEKENGDLWVWYGGGNVPSPAENLNGMIGCFTMRLSGMDNPTAFTAGDGWKNKNVSVRDFVKGAYDMEGTGDDSYIWCDDEVAVILKRAAGKNGLVIRGYIPFGLYDQTNISNIELSVFIDDHLAECRNCMLDETFEIMLEGALEDIDSDYFELKIKSSESVVPSKNGQANDERKLSYILKGIEQY